MLKNMELREGVGVFTSDDKQVGKINRVILDPETNEVTHVVVQKGWLLSEDKVVPLDMIRSTTDEKVRLSGNADDFNKLPPFEESHFVQTRSEDFPQAVDSPYDLSPAYFWYPPIVYPGYVAHSATSTPFPPPHLEKTRNIPEETIPLKEGANVISSDEKHVGDVERLFVDASSKKVTHFLITKGLFFKEHKLIPVHWVKYVGEEKIHLLVASSLLERLPDHTS
jgi:uncharacterized protein YrrD